MDTACPQFNAVESLDDLSVDNVGLSSTEGLSGSGGGTLAVCGLSAGLSVCGLSVCLSALSVCGLLMSGLSGGLSGLSATLLFELAGLSAGLSGLSVCDLSGGLSGLSMGGLLVSGLSAGIEGRLS